MRIISGKFKGIRLEPPKQMTARPTTDFAKESLFNVLNNTIDFCDIEVLDLFAGTGGVGLEFVSRGAKSVTAVEMGLVQVEFIKKTCAKLKIDNLHVYRGEVLKYLSKCCKKFDLIFADPPYQMPGIEHIPTIIFEKQLLLPNSFFVLEHGSNQSFITYNNFVEERVYGNVHFSFFCNNQ